MALPVGGLLERIGGLSLVRSFGLNTLKACNLAGFTVDTSSNVATTGTASFGVTTVGGLINTGTTMGSKANVISGSGATVTLTAAQSGSTALFDRAAGIVYTLPACSAGLTFNFAATVSVTTNSYKVITSTGTELLIGATESIDTDSTNAIAAWTGNGTTHIALTQAAASTNATGGLQGSFVTFRCLSSTLWLVSGTTLAAGTPTSPFATS